jgi:hypothetical protein
MKPCKRRFLRLCGGSGSQHLLRASEPCLRSRRSRAATCSRSLRSRRVHDSHRVAVHDGVSDFDGGRRGRGRRGARGSAGLGGRGRGSLGGVRGGRVRRGVGGGRLGSRLQASRVLGERGITITRISADAVRGGAEADGVVTVDVAPLVREAGPLSDGAARLGVRGGVRGGLRLGLGLRVRGGLRLGLRERVNLGLLVRVRRRCGRELAVASDLDVHAVPELLRRAVPGVGERDWACR